MTGVRVRLLIPCWATTFAAHWLLTWWMNASAILTGGSTPPKRLKLFLRRHPLTTMAQLNDEDTVVERYHAYGTGRKGRTGQTPSPVHPASAASSSSSLDIPVAMVSRPRRGDVLQWEDAPGGRRPVLVDTPTSSVSSGTDSEGPEVTVVQGPRELAQRPPGGAPRAMVEPPPARGDAAAPLLDEAAREDAERVRRACKL